MRSRALTYLLYSVAAALVVVATAFVPHIRPASPPRETFVTPPPPHVVEVKLPLIQTIPQQPPEQPEIDVIFALDTTSSMNGLIDGAKRKIWSLVDFMSAAQPQPKVRVGIVAYRDVGDAYVTRFFDLSDDIDGVFAHLRTLRAEGGGDTPEHVARALSDAVTRPSWSTGEKVVKLIYVVGDAPGHTDYQDGYNAPALARKAADLGIHVNAIRCGTDPEAASYFRQLARLGKGQYSTVDESGGVADSRTPYDDKMALLNRRLVGTAIGYGRGAAALEMKAAAAVSAPAAVAADRASFAARNHLAISGEDDLTVRAPAYVNSIPAKDLPPAMAAMAPAARESYVAGKKAERDSIMAEISTLSKSRSAFQKHAAAAAPAAGGSAGFDDSIRKTLMDQTAGVLVY